MAQRGGSNRFLLIVVLVVAIAIVALQNLPRSGVLGGVPAEVAPAAAPEPTEVVVPGGARPASSGNDAASPASGPTDEGDGFDASALAWAQVDLDEVRAAMPNNQYWEMSAPTTDERVLRERQEIRDERNRRYGRVLANLAPEPEIRDYFAERQRISADAVEFASHVLDHYRDVLPERDVRLLELARTLHLARLEEIPRRLADAIERRAEHEAMREAWLEQQRQFAPPGDDTGAAR